jgi:CubicO group peptidase (beta-lactamase class C family)
VFEQYFHGFHKDIPHDTRSASKIIAATLVGAAIERGEKLGTSTRVYDLLYHGAPPADMDPRKRDMTVEHLLTMSSGYDCDDWAGDRPGSEDKLLDDRPDSDFYRYTLQLPMELKPGEQAIYCSVNPNLLGAVLTAATGKPVLELFQDWIAGPLQFGNYDLNLQPTGEPYLGGGAKILPRDFMKFGQMMLDGGVWNGKRILGEDYARKAGSPLMQLRGENVKKYGYHYGYLWWTVDYQYKGKTISTYFAGGNGGQNVLVIPALDMVVACYGGNYGDSSGWTMMREYIAKYILPALVDQTR